ncbi:MAG: hypothetical protein AAGG07_13680 [Planctomycetota bacterium]
MKRSLAAATLSIIPLLTTLSGCARSYVVEVFNGSGSELNMRVVTDRLKPELLAERTLGPNEFARLGPVQAPITEAVRVDATNPADPGSLGAQQNISPGLNELEVYTTQGWGNLRFRVIRLGGRDAESLSVDSP